MILHDEIQIKEEAENMPKNLDVLKQIIYKLFSDRCKLKGIQIMQNQLNNLKNLLETFKYKQLYEYICSNSY